MNGKEKPLVYAVVLVYNGRKWLDNCLGSVLVSNYPNFRLLVVDNCSSDGSADYVEKNFPKAELFRTSRNYGTAEGNNVGSRYALKNGAEYILLLNQDTILEKECIDELVKLAERDKSMGMLIPAQYDYKKRKELSPTYQKFLESDKAKHREKDYVEMEKIIGAGMMLTKNFIEKVGLFDPFYFMYTEENDLVRRGYYHGFKTVFALQSIIYHWDHLFHGSSPKSRALYERNTLIEALKDIRQPLYRNLFDYYANLFRIELKPRGLSKGMRKFLRLLWMQKICFLVLPLIVIKRYKEKRFPCYL